jgi:uncharacterized RDD family membrane protein YckC
MNTPASPRTWYFVDAQGQQQGPVSVAILVGHARQGRVRPDSLVWREGWTDWQPLAIAAEELGLNPTPPAGSASAAAPAAAPARTVPAAEVATAARVSPYAPSAARLDVEAAWSAGGDIVYAGFLRRWAAFFVDSMVVVVAFYILLFALMMLFAGLNLAVPFDEDAFAEGGSLVALAVYPVWFGIAGLYYALMESSASQATLGKMALGIKVTDGDGRRLGFAHALGRWFAAALSYLTFYIGFFMAGFTERKRALHDLVASTLVVDKWAYTPHPERQQRGLGGCVIVFLVFIVLGGIAMIGIMAAVAIPAYQDYVERSRSRGAQLAPTIQQPPAAVMAKAAWPGAGRVWFAEQA